MPVRAPFEPEEPENPKSFEFIETNARTPGQNVARVKSRLISMIDLLEGLPAGEANTIMASLVLNFLYTKEDPRHFLSHMSQELLEALNENPSREDL